MFKMFAFCSVLILMDVLCGVVGAAKNRVLDSSIMREGMFNKAGELLLMLLAVLVEFALGLEPFSTMGVPPEVANAVFVYIAGMELLSIIENICKINPEIPLSKILYIFNLDEESKDDVDSGQASEE